MKRRLNAFRLANESKNGEPSISDFFNEFKNSDIEIESIKITDALSDKS